MKKNPKQLFDWHDPKLSNWRKLLRITYSHDFKDIECRGISTEEVAKRILFRHGNELKDDEKEFVKGLIK